MRSDNIPAYLGAAVMLLLAACATQPRAGESMEALERERFAAMVRQDTAALEPMLASDLVYCHSNGQCESRSEFLQTIATGRIRYRSIEVESLREREADGARILHGVIRVEGELGGKPSKMRLVFTDVYVRRDGRWQLAAWQSTVLPP